MTRHIDESVLHDFREGLLSPEAEEQVQEHLDGCLGCREELEEITKLMEGLRGLPTEAQPSRDLWPKIDWRIEGARTQAPTRADGSLDVPLSEPLEHRRGRWVSLPAWQLAAASVALMVISGASVWALLSGNEGPGAVLTTVPETSIHSVAWEEAYGGYDEAVEDLEALLKKGREVLDPETVRVLEESLQTIDMAIEEAGEAVSRDPASPVLQRFLAENLRKKMDLLRKAAMAVYATT